jgi:hypothetical protein
MKLFSYMVRPLRHVVPLDLMMPYHIIADVAIGDQDPCPWYWEPSTIASYWRGDISFFTFRPFFKLAVSIYKCFVRHSLADDGSTGAATWKVK